MAQVVQNREFAEILIERYEYTTVGVSSIEDFFITGVLGPIACPYDVVSSRPDVILGGRPYTGVEQYSHPAASTIKDSILS